MYIRLALIGLLVLGWSHAHVCAAGEAPQLCAISGHIVSDDGARLGWVVFDRNTGTIIDICDRKADVPSTAIVIEHDGYIFPGLIDTHNHCHWNAVPMWRPGRLFENRYEWQEDPEYYQEVRSPYNTIQNEGLWYESLKYGEIRAMIGGTTMLQGTNGADYGYLVRNLDYYGWLAYSYVEDVTEADPEFIATVKWAFNNGYIIRLFLHVAEGRSSDPRSQYEFPFLEDVGLTLPGVVIIHGVALTSDDFEIMAQNDMSLVWSPKSNDVLYGETADVLGALEAGVTVALGADWSISGSDNLLEELKVAYQYSVEHLDGAITPTQLFKMVTTDAAKVAGVDDPMWEGLGRIEVGYQADMFLAPKYDEDPHRSLLKTYSRDIQLLFIDGEPVYGDSHYVRRLTEAEELDEIDVSQKKKVVDLIDPEIGPFGEQRYDEVVGLLETILGEIAPLVEDEIGSHPGFPRRLP